MGQDLRTAETALAIIGAVLWAILPIPQIVKSFRLKSTKGLSPLLMLLWAIGAVFISAYAIVRQLSLALIIEPHIFGILAAVSWCQSLLYGSGVSVSTAIGAFAAFSGLYGFIEVTSIYAMLYAKDHNAELPILMYGYASSVLTVMGLVPQFVEIYRLKQVIGISYIFLWIGILGGFFMFASLCCREKLDYAAAAVYLATSFLNLAIYVLALVLNPRAKRLGIYIEDVNALADTTSTKAGMGAEDVEMGRTGGIALSDGTEDAASSESQKTALGGVDSGKKADVSVFQLELPTVPYAAGENRNSNYSLSSYDNYSPPATPLETPHWSMNHLPNDKEDSYFPRAESSDRCAEMAAYGQEEKKEGGEV